MILKFNRKKDWQFEKVLHNDSRADKLRLKNNTQKYAMWLWALIKAGYGKPLEDDKEYTMMGIHMSPSNIEWLCKRIGPWDALYYAPVYDETVADDEIIITHFVQEKI